MKAMRENIIYTRIYIYILFCTLFKKMRDYPIKKELKIYFLFTPNACFKMSSSLMPRSSSISRLSAKEKFSIRVKLRESRLPNFSTPIACLQQIHVASCCADSFEYRRQRIWARCNFLVWFEKSLSWFHRRSKYW